MGEERIDVRCGEQVISKFSTVKLTVSRSISSIDNLDKRQHLKLFACTQFTCR
jgi:hypothetical protein